MLHWRRRTTKSDILFWITCKQLAFLISFSCLQVIQNKHPWCSAAAYVTARLILHNQSHANRFYPITVLSFMNVPSKINAGVVLYAFNMRVRFWLVKNTQCVEISFKGAFSFLFSLGPCLLRIPIVRFSHMQYLKKFLKYLSHRD